MLHPVRSILRSLALATICLTAGPAAARSEKTLAYTREQAWPTAVRFVRVDERLAVTEKDESSGYILFELKDDGKMFRGSLEIVTAVVDHRPVVRFVIAIEDRPSYVELAMLKRLEQKLKLELGAPAPAPTPTKPTPTPPAPTPPPAKSPEPAAAAPGGPPISSTP